MTVSQSKQVENAGTEAVKILRLEKLKNGHPFLISSKDLPERRSYLEYPDGSIQIVEISENSRKFITVRVLSKK